MELAYKRLGEGKPLIILHGLYGMSDNWLTIAKALQNDFEIYLVDQRNHGDSPHSEEHTYEAMAKDLFTFANHHSLNSFHLLGHSMGGKTAMSFAKKYTEYVDKLVVVDISPRSYSQENAQEIPQHSDHKKIMETLLKVNFNNVKTRNEITQQLMLDIKSEKIVRFLSKNIKKTDDGYSWKLNIHTLYKNLDNILSGISQDQLKDLFCKPALFIEGGESEYINSNDVTLIKQLFPNSELITLPNAGHWAHAEQPDTFISHVKRFLKG